MVSRKLKFVERHPRYDGAAHITCLLRQFQAAEAKTKEEAEKICGFDCFDKRFEGKILAFRNECHSPESNKNESYILYAFRSWNKNTKSERSPCWSLVRVL